MLYAFPSSELQTQFGKTLCDDKEYRRLFPRALDFDCYRQGATGFLQREAQRITQDRLEEWYVGLTATSMLRVTNPAHRSPRPLPVKTVDVGEAIRKFSPLVITGEPGSGKTTCLLNAASTELRHTSAALPLYVPLRGFSTVPGPLHGGILDRGLLDRIRTSFVQCGVSYGESGCEIFLEDLKRQPFLFLFDGLDEIDWAHRYSAIRALRSFSALLEDLNSRPPGHERHRLVITTRKLNYNPADLEFYTLELVEMNRKQITEFLYRYLPEASDVQTVLRYFDLHSQVLSYAQNPRWLFYIAEVYRKHHVLPVSLGRLLDQVTDIFLQPAAESNGQRIAGVADVKRQLAPIGRELQRRGGVVLSEEEAFALVAAALSPTQVPALSSGKDLDPNAYLNALVRTGILNWDVAGGAGGSQNRALRFRDKTVQEYFAALCLLHEFTAAGGGGPGLQALRPYLADPRWQEAVVLLPGMLATEDVYVLANYLRGDNVVLMGRVLGSAEQLDHHWMKSMVDDLTRTLRRALKLVTILGVLPAVTIVGSWCTVLMLLMIFVIPLARNEQLLGIDSRPLGLWGLLGLLAVPLVLVGVLPHVIHRFYWPCAFRWQRRLREASFLPYIGALRYIGSREARNSLRVLEAKVLDHVHRVGGLLTPEANSPTDPYEAIYFDIVEDIQAACEVVATSPEQLVDAVRHGRGTHFYLEQLLQVDRSDYPLTVAAEAVLYNASEGGEIIKSLDRIVLKGPREGRFRSCVAMFVSLLRNPNVALGTKLIIYRSLRDVGELGGWWILDSEFIVQIALPALRGLLGRVGQLASGASRPVLNWIRRMWTKRK